MFSTTVSKKLKTKENMKSQRERLSKLKFNQYQIDQMMQSKCPKNSIQALIFNFTKLAKILSHDEMCRFVTRISANRKFHVLLENHRNLLKLGFDHNQIVRLCINNGSVLNVQYVISLTKKLISKELNNEDIVRLSARPGGYLNLKCVNRLFRTLRDLHFSKEQIVSIFAHEGSHSAGECLVQFMEIYDSYSLELSHVEIVRMLRNGNVTEVINALLAFLPVQDNEGWNYTSAQIVKVLQAMGGVDNLKALTVLTNELKRKGHSEIDIALIAQRPRGFLCMYTLAGIKKPQVMQPRVLRLSSDSRRNSVQSSVVVSEVKSVPSLSMNRAPLFSVGVAPNKRKSTETKEVDQGDSKRLYQSVNKGGELHTEPFLPRNRMQCKGLFFNKSGSSFCFAVPPKSILTFR